MATRDVRPALFGKLNCSAVRIYSRGRRIVRHRLDTRYSKIDWATTLAASRAIAGVT